MGLCFVLGAALLAVLCPRALAQITTPLQLPPNETGLSDTLSYVLAVEGKPYTIHLKKHLFIPDDFRIYMSDETGSSVSDSSYIKGDCYYHGSIEGVPGSAVTLSICAGLRGLLQFHNVSYGIEPLGSSPTFEHLVYRMNSENAAGSLFTQNHSRAAGWGLQEPPLVAVQLPKYIEVHVVLDKALYNYLGSNQRAVTQKMVQVFNLVNKIFKPLNMTVVLSSLELWVQQNKIPTDGAADELLQQFLQWKQLHLALQPHDVACLFVYRDQADFAIATSPSTLCRSDASGAVAVLQPAVTLESFSVLLAQLVGRSLGMGFDDNRGCHCPTHTCVMESAALHRSGAKTFSSCSAADLEQFLQQNPNCPFLRALWVHPNPKVAICGNGVVEHSEQCDCGGDVVCAKDACCTRQCKLKPGSMCSLGLCCEKCQFKAPNTLCRPAADTQCDLPEFCNGSSASCPTDVYVQDGHSCEHDTGYCYHGRCQSAELQCRRIYGRGAKNAPLACYEEINSHQDRFGHCSNHQLNGYQPCSWLNLGCGKLVCTYPNRVPFTRFKGSIIYAQVQEHLCVSFDGMYSPSEEDPLLVKDGTKCGDGKVCMNGTCQPHSILNYDCNVQKKCSGHGVCNNKKNCHCHPGWSPPYCRVKGSAVGGSTDSGQWRRDINSLAPENTIKNVLLLTFCLLIPILICIIILIMKWNQLMRRCAGSEAASYASTEYDTSSFRSNLSVCSRQSSGSGMEPEPERRSRQSAGELREQ
ncbi:disintegrin and metalloproteinase domain-containing protein 32-like isoform X3 [Coturnix japonica]|uniref:disintegrin and metalloproteinase domain-containing protein 32-like isoform X3 n=1 Tax=Coturnix japonica TaxID=93934 RepID=UPI0013A5CC5D|nr:disintegrin and metalloproteinase domain-containing protein 32-like isoform X3 [Coturnix japonica]